VSTSTDGTMKIWQAANGEIRVRAAALFGVVCDVAKSFNHNLGQAVCML